MQKNRFFQNDVTQDTDARKKYSLQTLLAGKLFLQIIWHSTQKEPYLLGGTVGYPAQPGLIYLEEPQVTQPNQD